MKNWFVVVRGYHQGIFKTELEAKKETEGYFDFKYKGFDTYEEAKAYLKNYQEEDVPHVYVVKCGWVPGIYEREDVKKQIEGFENPCVRKYKKSDIELAKKFLESSVIDKRKKEKREKPNKIEEIIREIRKTELKFKNRYICFFDSEANNSKVISIGAVMLDTENMNIVGKFYKGCRYKSFTKMDSHCEKISNITTENVLNYDDFLVSYEEWKNWLESFKCKEICTWSSNDKEFLNKTIAEYDQSIDSNLNFINIQKRISSETVDLVANFRWSLCDIKYFYGFDKKVCHNALIDADDLCKVYIAWKNKALISERVMEYSKAK